MAKIYQRGNQKPDIKDGHVIQWPKIPKGGNQNLDIEDGHDMQWPRVKG